MMSERTAMQMVDVMGKVAKPSTDPVAGFYHFLTEYATVRI